MSKRLKFLDKLGPLISQGSLIGDSVFKLRARSFYVHLSRSVCLSVGPSVCRSVEKIEKAVKIGDFKHDQERKDEEEEEQDKDEKEGKDKEEKEEKKEEEKEEKKEEGNDNNEDKDKVKDADNDGKFFSLMQDILLFTLLSFLMDQR